MISTLSSGVVRRALVGEPVLRFLEQSLPVGRAHDLVRDAVDRDVGQRRAVRRPGPRCGSCSTATRRCRAASVSTSSAPIIASARRRRPGSAATCTIRITNGDVTRTPHTTDGARRNDSSGERRRCRSASRSGPSGRRSAARSCPKQRPTTSAGPARQRRHQHEDDRQHQPRRRAGGAQRGEVDDLSPPPRSIVTGTRNVPSTSSARSTGDSRQDRPASCGRSGSPAPMPRNEPSSTKLEK